MLQRSLKIKVTSFWAFICFFGYFVLTSTIRHMLSNNAIVRYINIPSIVGVTVLLINCYHHENKNEIKKVVATVNMVLYIALILAFGISMSLYSVSSTNTIAQFVTMVAPTIICAYRFKNNNDLTRVFTIFVKFLRFCVILMVATIVIDLLTGFPITKYISEATNTESFYIMYRIHRPVTYQGHPLFSTQIFLIYYIFESLYTKYIEPQKTGITYFVISLFGIAAVQSKTGIVLILIIFILFNFSWKKSKYLILGLIILWIGFQLGILDGVINRFVASIAGGDVTSGRNTGLQQLVSAGVIQFNWLKGHYFQSESGSLFTAALEYPVINWAYQFGILTSFIMTLLLFVSPISKVLKNKQKDVLYGLLIIVADVNTYNGMAYTSDKVLFYCIVCCLLVNLSSMLFSSEESLKARKI